MMISKRKIKKNYLVVILATILLSPFLILAESNFNSQVSQRIDNNNVIFTTFLREFDNTTYLPVLVRLKDKSGIEITGTKEEKIALSGQRDEWYKQKISEILAMLPPDQFKLTGKRFNGFSGEITKKGFEQLKENLAVKGITGI